VAAALDAREAATHEDAKPENDKDTRSVEAAYLAGAQADRARALERVLAMLERLPKADLAPDAAIAAGALVELSTGGKVTACLLAPDGGGLRATVDGVPIHVVTTQSPLGEVLVGARCGEAVEVELRGKPVEHEIRAVR
jgi:transcription elongation GreA/GreB family factor